MAGVMGSDAEDTLAELELLALVSLRREIARLRRELEWEEPDEQRAHGVAGARMVVLDALELYVQAHDARNMIEMEGLGEQHES